MARYDDRFFRARHAKTLHSATKVLGIVSRVVPEIRSAVDIGCGVGTWLSVLRKDDTFEVQGVDGNWVNRAHLQIPVEFFKQHDLTKDLQLPRRYDLAISLEVAEHLPSHRAAPFVNLLTNLADFILFSAAIPYQGGRGHINEQWPDYWVKLFSERGYLVLDFIRPEIWNDSDITSWYKQNILFFVAADKLPSLNLPAESASSSALSLVHPDTYLKLRKQSPWKLFRKALKETAIRQRR